MLFNLGNQSSVTSFVLLGFSEHPHLQAPLFLMVLTIYTVTLLGNLGIIVVRKINSKLHTPMYFFLSHLSFLDICYSSVFTPKLLEILVVEDRTISFKGCMAQFFFGCACVITEMFMLAVMAYDRFVAVCNPLLCTVAMSPKLCAFLVAGTYVCGALCSLTVIYSLVQLSYCESNIINHFGCEYSAVLSVSCSDPSFSQMVCLIISIVTEACSLLITLASYVVIVVTIARMPSKGGLQKAFSTCTSHLTAISIFHGIILLLYCVPNSKSSWLLVKVATVLFIVLVPMLNPLIYSLRNKDVKDTVRRLINSKPSHLWNEGNQSAGVTFLLLGFSEDPNLLGSLFLGFLAIHELSSPGKLGVIVIIRINPQTPCPQFRCLISSVQFFYLELICGMDTAPQHSSIFFREIPAVDLTSVLCLGSLDRNLHSEFGLLVYSVAFRNEQLGEEREEWRWLMIQTREPSVLCGDLWYPRCRFRLIPTNQFSCMPGQSRGCGGSMQLKRNLNVLIAWRTSVSRRADWFMMSPVRNQSSMLTFILLGFSEYPELQVPLFLVFLSIYTVTVVGNLGMIIIIKINPKFHTIMYFFLSHLSFVDFCFSSVVTPKLLENLIVEDRTISFPGCIMQFCFACIFGVAETFMLTAMAYDRFVAICNPLRYAVTMSQKLCTLLVAGSYLWGIMCSLTLTYFLLSLSYRDSSIINNFTCEHSVIVAASCSDPYVSQMLCFIIAVFNEASSLVIVLMSYALIFITVMKMASAKGRWKTFSTCASHLTAIAIFHGTILLLYCASDATTSWLTVQVASVFYMVVIPMLNPLIYSLRNKDVKDTFRKLVFTKSLCHVT
ncbi:uncharacterized protein O8D03_013233 [Erethizon dorsatum]